jgi:plasmid stabilization system protein ParE
MRYKVVFTSASSKELVEIWDYHESVSNTARANRILNGILKLVDGLEILPNRYRSFEHKDYRCVSSGVYLIVYRVIEEDMTVSVEAVFDNRQDPMKLKKRLE